MKKAHVWLFLGMAFLWADLGAAEAKTNRYEASGELTSVDPLYQRITVKHGVIKGFSGAGETEFVLKSSDPFGGLKKRDLVEFTVVDESGDVRVEKIKVTGQAPPKDESLKLGPAVQEVVAATGEVAKGVTAPIAPAHEVVSGAVGVTTNATGAVLDNVEGPEMKKKF